MVKNIRIDKKIFIWIVLTLLAVIPFSLYFLRNGRSDDRDGISSGKRVFDKWEKEDVKEIVLSGNGRRKSFFLENGRWIYKSKEGDFPAKDEACDYIVDILSDLSSTNLLYSEVERPHLYGLTDEGGYRIEFKDHDWNQLTMIRIGLPLGETDFNYLSVEGRPEIYRIDRQLAVLSMGVSLLDLRVFPELAGAAKISEFRIAAIVDDPNLNYLLTQDENDFWSVNGQLFNDSHKIVGVINSVVDWQGESFVGIDHSQWNDAPLRIQIVDRDGKASILLIGEQIDKRAFAAKRLGSDLVYRLTVESLSGLEGLLYFYAE